MHRPQRDQRSAAAAVKLDPLDPLATRCGRPAEQHQAVVVGRVIEAQVDAVPGVIDLKVLVPAEVLGHAGGGQVPRRFRPGDEAHAERAAFVWQFCRRQTPAAAAAERPIAPAARPMAAWGVCMNQ